MRDELHEPPAVDHCDSGNSSQTVLLFARLRMMFMRRDDAVANWGNVELP